MNKGILRVLSILAYTVAVLFSMISSPPAQEDGTPVTIGTYRTMHSQVLDEDRTLLVSLPRDYAESTIRYPVLYVLYGGQVRGYFAESVHIVDRLSEASVIPQLIIVGIQNVDRYRDNLPVDRRGQEGGSESFLKFLTDELMPFVDGSYRTKEFRILLGPQAGAAFGLYALMEQPQLFRVNIITDPFWHRPVTDYLLAKASDFFQQEGKAENFLFITCNSSGDREPTDEHLENLRGIVEEGKQGGVVLVLNALGEATPDSSILAPGLREGLKAYFKGFEFPADAKVDGLEDVKEYYGTLSREYDYEVEIPERTLISQGVKLGQQGQIEEAKMMYEYAAKQYPGQVNSYFQLAALHRRAGDYEQAIKYYEEFLARRAEPFVEQTLLSLRKYVRESAAHSIEETIKTSGLDAGVARYRELASDDQSELYFQEREFNTVGYLFLAQGKLDAAIEVFRMNVEMNPESANACDSLGESYLLKGDREAAAKYYRRSLELNPDNANAREKLADLEKSGE